MGEYTLRPLGFGETLDASFTVYRRAFGTLFLAALIPLLPAAVFWLLVASSAGSPSADALLVWSGLVEFYAMAAAFFTWAALFYLIARAVHNEPISIGSGYARAIRRLIPAVVAMILTFFLVGIGFIFLIIPGILLAIMCFAVLPVVIIEGGGPVKAIRRSRFLASGGYGRIFGVYVVATLITMLPVVVLWGSAGFGAMLEPTAADRMAAGGRMFAIAQGLGYLVNALTVPFSTAVLVLLYYDRRVRVEAYGLDLAEPETVNAGATAPDAASPTERTGQGPDA